MKTLRLAHVQLESSGVQAIRRFLQEELVEMRARCGTFQDLKDSQADLVLTAKLRGEIALAQKLIDMLDVKSYNDMREED